MRGWWLNFSAKKVTSNMFWKVCDRWCDLNEQVLRRNCIFYKENNMNGANSLRIC